MTSRDFRAREHEAWMRTGQIGCRERLQGEQRLETLGERTLAFLAEYLDAQVGAIYIAERDGRFRRFGGYALPGRRRTDVLRPGESACSGRRRRTTACVASPSARRTI